MICKPTEKRNSVIVKITGRKEFRCDECIRNLLLALDRYGFYTVASCCGHGRYPLTIIYEVRGGTNKYYELMSGLEIPRTRKFYKKYLDGYFYIPEVLK